MSRNGFEPAPGELRLPMVAAAILFGLSLAGLIAALICSFFFADLETAIIALAILTGIGAVGLLVTVIQRRNYLRDKRNGNIIQRKLFTGGDVHSQ